jgi:predicted DNA-binding transcriptional regulator AlpA
VNTPRQLDRAAVAALLGVKPATITQMRAAGRNFPEPDGVIGKSPWWWESTITAWQKTRPGRGARTDRAS